MSSSHCCFLHDAAFPAGSGPRPRALTWVIDITPTSVRNIGLPPQGDCCAPGETCTLSMLANCAPHAVWRGQFTVCDPNPCLRPVPTERPSRGQNKNRCVRWVSGAGPLGFSG